MPLYKIIFETKPTRPSSNNENEEHQASEGNGHFHIPLDLPQLSSMPSSDLFAHFALDSAFLAGRLFQRAGTYLYLGFVIAAVGIAVFYLTYQPPTDPAIIGFLNAYGPRLGVFIFLELLAFSFCVNIACLWMNFGILKL